MFPFLLFLRSLVPYTPWTERLVDAGLEALATLVNPGSELYSIVADNVISQVRTASQTLLSIGALLTLWSASSVFGVLIKALNRAYGLQETRSWYRRRGLAVVLTLVMLLLVPAGFALLLVGPFVGRLIGRYAGGAEGFEVVWSFVRWPLVFAFLAGALAIVYYFAPNTRQKWHWLTLGSLVAVAAVVVESLVLSWALGTRLFRPQWLTYGAIGAAIIIVFWLYLIGLSVLVGAEVNAAVERLTGPSATTLRSVPRRRRLRAHLGDSPSSHASHESMPSPVRAERVSTSMAGLTARMFARIRVQVDLEIGEQIDLGDHRQRGLEEHQRVLEWLVFTLGHRQQHDLAMLADVELGRTHQVAHVLHDQQVESVQVELARSPPRPGERQGGSLPRRAPC